LGFKENVSNVLNRKGKGNGITQKPQVQPKSW